MNRLVIIIKPYLYILFFSIFVLSLLIAMFLPTEYRYKKVKRKPFENLISENVYEKNGLFFTTAVKDFYLGEEKSMKLIEIKAGAQLKGRKRKDYLGRNYIDWKPFVKTTTN